MAKPPKILQPDQSLIAYFGYELRKHREERGLSQPGLAEQLHWAKSTVSHLETAARCPTEEHARDLDLFFGTDRFGWLYRLIMKNELPDFFRPFAAREPDASDIRAFQPLVIPGLLQTPEYARALFRTWKRPEEVEQAVAARMERQKILYREKPDPPHLWVIMDEWVIKRLVGGPEVMRKQLAHLLDIGERPNVTIQLVPVSIGEYPGLTGGISILSFEDGGDIAYSGASFGGYTIERQKDVSRLARSFELIRAEALSAKESAKLIREAMMHIAESAVDWRKGSRSSAQGDDCVEISVIERAAD